MLQITQEKQINKLEMRKKDKLNWEEVWMFLRKYSSRICKNPHYRQWSMKFYLFKVNVLRTDGPTDRPAYIVTYRVA